MIWSPPGMNTRPPIIYNTYERSSASPEWNAHWFFLVTMLHSTLHADVIVTAMIVT